MKITFKEDMKDLCVNNLMSVFPDSHNRISIWAETDKYNWKEDESVWKQKRGIDAPQFEAYFDGQFICFMDSNKGNRYNLIEFLNNIKRLYKEGKIFVNKEMYAVRDAEEAAKQEKAKNVIIPKATTPEERMIVHVLKKSAKKKGKKVIEK